MDFLLVLHLIFAVALIGVVLVQKSEGGALGIGGSGGGFMSARGAANLLTRATAILAGLFMISSLALTMLARTGGEGSIVDRIEQQQAPVLVPSEPAVPAPATTTPSTPAPTESVPAPAPVPGSAPPTPAN
ncbi:preprotein translocase subunit SecG [Oleomonas cavernae]|uniref:Protein-export membrane protein SecG n=1 Tax=Oleomonas cavernae TaxID=2320859 RepID=A0A418WBK1_9PROT|nr:preprotein translocase subunit SecG [Oleomonas cavernae]RJF87417.1 preprotein translocase subunit SecG [Oleomonas cavernae]